MPGRRKVNGIKAFPKWNKGKNAEAEAPMDEIDMA